MRTLKEAREYERTQKPKPLDTYLKHLGQNELSNYDCQRTWNQTFLWGNFS